MHKFTKVSQIAIMEIIGEKHISGRHRNGENKERDQFLYAALGTLNISMQIYCCSLNRNASKCV